MRLRDLPDPWRRLLAVVGFVVLAEVFIGAFAMGRPTAPPDATPPGGADLVLYGKIIDRVRAGEGYYSVAFEELGAGGYPTGSVFNWRLPTYAWFLAALGPWSQPLLIGLAILALGLAFAFESRHGGPGKAIVVLLLVTGALVWCIDGQAFLAQEVWAAVVLTIALACYGLHWPWLGFMAAAAALSMRELVLPFTILAACQAYRQQRCREVIAWGVVWSLFLAFFAWHAHQLPHSPPNAGPADSWVACGGVSFVLRTVQMNQWLFNMPLVAAACFLGMAVVGLLAWPGEDGRLFRLTTLVYAGAFLIVGKPCNNYWGLLFAPALPFGIVRAAAGFRALVPETAFVYIRQRWSILACRQDAISDATPSAPLPPV